MKLCLKCGRLSPSGPASAYCLNCGRSFKGKRCPAQHLSPPGAKRCITCSSDQLTETAPSIPLAWAVYLLSIAFTAVCARLALTHLCCLSHYFWSAATWAIGFLIDVPPAGVRRGIARLLTWLAILYLASFCFPGIGKPFRKVLAQTVLTLLRLAWWLCVAVWKSSTGKPGTADRK